MSKIKYLRFLFGLFIFFSVFSFSSHALAATIITDDIMENTTWTLNNSPYVVKNNILVWPDTILTIEPGVVVKVAPNSGLGVWGSLSAEGTSENHIFFTSLWDDTIAGDTNGDGKKTVPVVSMWNQQGLFGGVYFDAAEGVSLNNVDISFSKNGFNFWSTSASISNIKGRKNIHDLNVWEGSNVTLSGGDFFGSLYESVYLVDSILTGDHITVDSTQNWQGFITFNSDLFLTDSLIQNSLKVQGMQGVGAEGPGTVNLERVTIKNIFQGVVGYEGVILNIKNSILDKSGVVTWGGAVANIDNSVIQNGGSIVDYGNSIFNITNNKIINNYIGVDIYA
ncbi:MAG: hypothetical protein V4699_03895, partial [Patescibacteria group bacterium]